MVRNRQSKTHAIKIQNGETISGALAHHRPCEVQALANTSRNGFEPATEFETDLVPTSAGQILRRRLGRYGPVAVWISLIFWASTEQFSSEHTAQVIQPWITWFFPSMSPATVDWLHAVIRKSAHVTEYAIFALLTARALIGSFRPSLARRWFVICCFLLAVVAATDEFHQSFVPSRTAAIADVLIDFSAGLTALTTLALWRRWRSDWKLGSGQFDSVTFFVEQRNGSVRDFKINDQGKTIVVRAEVPGFAASELDLNLQGNLLVFRARKQIEAKGKKQDFDELNLQELYRCTPIPSGIDAARTEASYCEGVLTVTLLKLPKRTIDRVAVEGRRTRQPSSAIEVGRGTARRMRNDVAQWPRRVVERAARLPAPRTTEQHRRRD